MADQKEPLAWYQDKRFFSFRCNRFHPVSTPLQRDFFLMISGSSQQHFLAEKSAITKFYKRQ